MPRQIFDFLTKKTHDRAASAFSPSTMAHHHDPWRFVIKGIFVENDRKGCNL